MWTLRAGTVVLWTLCPTLEGLGLSRSGPATCCPSDLGRACWSAPLCLGVLICAGPAEVSLAGCDKDWRGGTVEGVGAEPLRAVVGHRLGQRGLHHGRFPHVHLPLPYAKGPGGGSVTGPSPAPVALSPPTHIPIRGGVASPQVHSPLKPQHGCYLEVGSEQM